MKHLSHHHQRNPSRQIRPVSKTNHEILSLDHPSAMALSHAASHPVLWISIRPPQQVLGVLGTNIQGAWYEVPNTIVALEGRRFVHPVPSAPTADMHAVLRAVLESHLNGTVSLPASGRLQSPELESFSA